MTQIKALAMSAPYQKKVLVKLLVVIVYVAQIDLVNIRYMLAQHIVISNPILIIHVYHSFSMHVISAQFYRLGHTQVGCQNGLKSFFTEELVGKIMDGVIMCFEAIWIVSCLCMCYTWHVRAFDI